MSTPTIAPPQVDETSGMVKPPGDGKAPQAEKKTCDNLVMLTLHRDGRRN